jgi:hypothetical protein
MCKTYEKRVIMIMLFDINNITLQFNIKLNFFF